jgi:cytochrome bd-type quinol oxidase subunit 2
MSIEECRKRLAIVWFVISGVLFFVLILQTIFGRYADRVSEAWSWFLPTIMPSLSLIAATWASDLSRESTQAEKANAFLYRLALLVSVFYLCAIVLVVFASAFSQIPPLEMMRQSNLFLGPIQGLVAAVIGIFFVRKSEKKSPHQADAPSK